MRCTSDDPGPARLSSGAARLTPVQRPAHVVIRPAELTWVDRPLFVLADPFYSHYVLLLTWVLAIIGWFVAFFSMCVGESQKARGVGSVFNTSVRAIHRFLAAL